VGISETVLAAMIGAIATVGTALFQLIMNWRKQSGDRRVTTKGGVRSLLWVVTLMLASGVGGFAYSEYLGQGRREEAHELRQELQQQVQTLAASTAKLEQVRLNAESMADAQSRRAEDRRRGLDGVEGLIQLPACKGKAAGSGAERPTCAESDAQRAAVCAVVPASATVTEVQLFTRPDESQQPWNESRVIVGLDAGSAKFIDGSFERGHTDATKEVCFNFASWNAEKARTARIVVRYTL
jgi:hypothetical protein